jgi:Tfp pilus assembly protein PilP
MARKLLFLLLALASCSKGPQADLQYISQARSLAAEWALINEQSSEGKLNHTYTRVMRQDLREQLQTTAKSLTQPNSRYGEEIQAVLKEPDEASPEELRSHADELKQIEDSLESA